MYDCIWCSKSNFYHIKWNMKHIMSWFLKHRMCHIYHLISNIQYRIFDIKCIVWNIRQMYMLFDTQFCIFIYATPYFTFKINIEDVIYMYMYTHNLYSKCKCIQITMTMTKVPHESPVSPDRSFFAQGLARRRRRVPKCSELAACGAHLATGCEAKWKTLGMLVIYPSLKLTVRTRKKINGLNPQPPFFRGYVLFPAV